MKERFRRVIYVVYVLNGKFKKIKPKDRCRWDLVALGEVMLRLDPGDGKFTHADFSGLGRRRRIQRRARVAALLRGKTAIVTALADNPVGRLVEDLICRAASTRRTSSG